MINTTEGLVFPLGESSVPELTAPISGMSAIESGVLCDINAIIISKMYSMLVLYIFHGTSIVVPILFDISFRGHFFPTVLELGCVRFRDFQREGGSKSVASQIQKVLSKSLDTAKVVGSS
jgi:hypothetical protein